MAINVGGYDLDGPHRIDRWIPPHEEGVYAVLRQTAMADGATAFTPIYIEETDDFAAHDLPTGHPGYARWTAESGGVRNTYIGVIYTPGDGNLLRGLVRDTLLSQFHPVCNYD